MKLKSSKDVIWRSINPTRVELFPGRWDRTCAQRSTFSIQWRCCSCATRMVMTMNIPTFIIACEGKMKQYSLTMHNETHDYGIHYIHTSGAWRHTSAYLPLLYTTPYTVLSRSLILILRFILITTSIYTLITTMFTLSTPCIPNLLATLKYEFIARMSELQGNVVFSITVLSGYHAFSGGCITTIQNIYWVKITVSHQYNFLELF